jgi:hypothetical protein
VVTSTSAPRCQPSLVAADDASHKDMLVMRAQRARCVPDRRSTRGSSRSPRDKPPRSPQVTESAGGSAAAPQISQADSPTPLGPPNPRHAGHTRDGTQSSIEPRGVAACHRGRANPRRGGL